MEKKLQVCNGESNYLPQRRRRFNHLSSLSAQTRRSLSKKKTNPNCSAAQPRVISADARAVDVTAGMGKQELSGPF